MAKATPAQLRLYRHRWRMALFIELIFLILSPVIGMTMFVLFNNYGDLAKAISIVSFVLVFVCGQVVRHVYFRCPVCKYSLPRGPRQVEKLSDLFKGRCNNCRTEYTA